MDRLDLVPWAEEHGEGDAPGGAPGLMDGVRGEVDAAAEVDGGVDGVVDVGLSGKSGGGLWGIARAYDRPAVLRSHPQLENGGGS